jgi:hypothetical protein
MLRLLMSWCVPSRALRFNTNFDGTRSDRDAAGGQNLWAALASHGIGSGQDPATQQSA